MKYIIYKSQGFMQVLDESGEIVDKEIEGLGQMPYSKENLEYAKAVAVDGEYTIEDDGQPEPVVEPTAEEMFNALLGVTE